MEKLRSKTPLDHITNAAIGPKTQAVKITSASEVVLNFAMPAAATTIKIGTPGHESFISFTPAPAYVAASIDSATGAGDPWAVQVSAAQHGPSVCLF
jgi:hypothetical protein